MNTCNALSSLVLAGTLIAPAASAGDDDAAKAATEQSAAVAEESKEFTPPDGWRAKKRGKFTLYCRKDYNAKGTRFPAEICHDEAGIRAMLEAQREDREKVDQMRRVCAADGCVR